MKKIFALLVALSVMFAFGCKKDEGKKDSSAPKTADKKDDKGADKDADKKNDQPDGDDKKDDAADDGPFALHDKCWTAFAEADWATYEGCYAENATIDMIDSVPPMDKEIAKALEWGKAWHAAMGPKYQFQLKARNGNTLANVHLMTAKNTGEFMGMPATNKEVGMWGAQIVQLDDAGKVAEIRMYRDQATLMHQLGVAPNPMSPDPVTEMMGETIEVVAKDDEMEKKNLEALKGMAEAMKNKDPKPMLALYADDAMFASAGDKKVHKGMAEIEKGMGEWMGMHDTLEVVDSKSWAAGDWVITESTMTGKLAIDMPTPDGKKAKTKGKSYTMSFVEFMHFADGKIKKHYLFGNGLKFAVDVGMVDMKMMMGAKGGDKAEGEKAEGEKKEKK